ncbi:hypothetical protein LPTSP4_12060 [Leptospira ryugenii]|uniref:Lipoprotein n=1 Tax=Leptospira ryugenii TaxID=1917863 RepID=A0A2P2DYL3_9LEPT|nr:hypothetical protein [Leptospira ryugenii]GBF49690.1 hypothetical protein LPTSP4_12060 [Leptospira ryugenii]
MRNKANSIVIGFLLLSCFCIGNVKQKKAEYRSESSAVQKQLDQLKMYFKSYALLDEAYAERLWKYANHTCDFKRAGKVETSVKPFYELKSNDLDCHWNYRKELISFTKRLHSVNDLISVEEVYFYRDKPTRLKLRIKDSDWSVERYYDWNLMRFSWIQKFTMVQFTHNNSTRKVRYLFDILNEDVRKVESLLVEDGKEVLDGWQFLQGFYQSPERCEYFEKGEKSKEENTCTLMSASFPERATLLPTFPEE